MRFRPASPHEQAAPAPAPDPPDAPEVVEAVIDDAEASLTGGGLVEARRRYQVEAGRAGGKLGGRPRKGTRQAVTRLCQRMVTHPEYQRQLQARLLAGRLSPVMEAALWAYAYGKPTESIDVNAKVAAVVSVVKPW
jgi:hypothetical protein